MAGSSYQSDLDAKIFLETSRAAAYQNTFANTSLSKKKTSIASDASAISEAGMEFASNVADACGSSVPDVVGAVPAFGALNAVLKIVGIEEGEKENFELIMAEELAVLASNGLMSIASMYTPYLSTVVAGKDMVKAWVDTAVNGHKAYTLQRTIKSDILPGDPQAGARAVRKLIARNANNSARIASINSAKFAVDVAATAGAFGGGGAIAGPVTGAAAAGAKLSNALFLLGRDYHEMSGANKLLTSGVVPPSETLFGTYPMLGCYLIVGVSDSDLLYFVMGDMGGKGWMDKVEKQKRTTLGPLQDEARRAIADARFELDGFKGQGTIIVPKKHTKMQHIKSWAQRVFW